MPGDLQVAGLCAQIEASGRQYQRQDPDSRLVNRFGPKFFQAFDKRHDTLAASRA